MRCLGCLSIALIAVGAACVEESGAEPEPSYGGRGRVASTRGSAVVMTYDERVAVTAHRTSGVITVFHLDEALHPEVATTIDVGVDAKPWAAVIGEDDDSAYVLLRGAQRVVRVRGLHSEHPELDADDWPTGAEPTAIAITPSGARVYVANWGEGTVSTFRTDARSVDEATDLNLELARTGVLGALIGAGAAWQEQDFADFGAARPGLAHPRALAITDDGDTEDEGEILYASEFFSQPLLGEQGEQQSDPDLDRQGFVYAIDVTTGLAPVDPETRQGRPPIALAALETGFVDAEGNPTRCFPNQLYAMATAGERLYVSGVCASPRGPVEPGPDFSPANFKTVVHPAIFQIDTVGHRELPHAALVLSDAMVKQYGDGPDVRMPLIPNDLAIASRGSEGSRLYVTALGADAVFSVDYDPDGLPERIGSEDAPFIDLRSPARLPIGVALTSLAADPAALVLSDFSDILSVVDRDRATVEEHLFRDELAERVNRRVREGRRLFATGLDNWSFRGQGWSSCESCHPEGLSDGVVWQFARGPRRTISTAGTYYGDAEDPTQRVLLWTANIDEIHDVEAIARGVSGGAGGIAWKPYQELPDPDCRLLYAGEMSRPPDANDDCPQQLSTTLRHNGLNGSLRELGRKDGESSCAADAAECNVSSLPDWDHIDAFIRSVRAPRAPTTVVKRYAESGEALFRTLRCATCHGGPGWTVSRMFYAPSVANNGAVPYARPTQQVITDLPAMLGSLRLATYAAPPVFAPLNGPLDNALKALGDAAFGPDAVAVRAPFRSWKPEDGTLEKTIEYLYAGPDQINCALRSVGTYPVQPSDPMEPRNLVGIVAPGVAPVREVKRTLVPSLPAADAAYKDTLAVGSTGFNVPTLTGMAVAGTYFHAGNARTLEELFDPTFWAHHANPALVPSRVLQPQEVRDLVSYLLSIDDEPESPVPPPIEPMQVDGAVFVPDLCRQLE